MENKHLLESGCGGDYETEMEKEEGEEEGGNKGGISPSKLKARPFRFSPVVIFKLLHGNFSLTENDL